ncbi:MAG: hypothetical protein ACP5N2_04455 [Candidatus Nanoarchaeia archaeon]
MPMLAKQSRIEVKRNRQKLITQIQLLAQQSWNTLPRNVIADDSTPDNVYYPSVLFSGHGLDDLLALMTCVSKYLNPLNSKFADLGGGDGVPSFIARAYEFDAYCIESNPLLSNTAINYSAILNLTNKMHIIPGNWRQTNTYKNAGIYFEDIDFFYLYPAYGGLQVAYNMVSSKSKKGTILAVKQSGENNRATLPRELTMIQTIDSKISPIDIYRKE